MAPVAGAPEIPPVLEKDVRRRDFIKVTAGLAVTWPRLATAQQGSPVIGFLHLGSPAANAKRLAGFRKGLGDAGFTDGQNVAIDYRWAEGRGDRLAELAADLVRRQVSVIVTLSATQAALAAKAATNTIPIVFQVGSDPVDIGLVASLNRPGGNATGVSSLSAKIVPKRIGLLREVVPSIANVSVLANPSNPNASSMANELATVSRQLNLQARVLLASNDDEIRAAFKQASSKPDSALVVGNDPNFFIRRSLLASLAIEHDLPMIAYEREFAIDGSLMSYGTKSDSAWEMAGGYVARILRGEHPRDLPVMQVAVFELVLNLKTAKALGVPVPATVMALADEIIE
jgi:putative tryptophan/tyrosine transport system substrate-binding protein